MDAIDSFNAASAFNTNTPTRESDIRSSKRSRKHGGHGSAADGSSGVDNSSGAAARVSGSAVGAAAARLGGRDEVDDDDENDQEREGFNTNQFISYGSGDVLDPQLANISKPPSAASSKRSNSQASRQRQAAHLARSLPDGVLEQLGNPAAVSLAMANEQGMALTEDAQDAVAAAAAAVVTASIAATLASTRGAGNSATSAAGAESDSIVPATVKKRKRQANLNDARDQHREGAASITSPLNLIHDQTGLGHPHHHQQQAQAQQQLPPPQARRQDTHAGLPPVAAVNGGSFTPEETVALETFMQEYGREHDLDHEGLCRRVWANERKKDNFWDAVTNALPHRTRASVYKHVRRKYHPYEQRGKWTPAEEEQLRQLKDEYGAQWKIIGKHIGRMPEDCRDRWRNYVKCGTSRGQNKWSVEEEVKLIQIVNEIRYSHPGSEVNWTVVSEKMGGIRSRIQCRYKWKKLTRTGAASDIMGINGQS
ncbi:hypothetical protein BZA70DRAFT_43902 [Myxozyma melibiosi]|uniref:Uncharacterized protein n=1 Tax=Myxozyma melibiosi TaxID=54550 RepID=A0ABR1FEN3_9ASCO